MRDTAIAVLEGFADVDEALVRPVEMIDHLLQWHVIRSRDVIVRIRTKELEFGQTNEAQPDGWWSPFTVLVEEVEKRGQITVNLSETHGGESYRTSTTTVPSVVA
jgi:hypothetical protein